MKRSAKLRSRQRAASGVAMIGLGVYVATARASEARGSVVGQRFDAGAAREAGYDLVLRQIDHRDRAVAMVGHQDGFAVGSEGESHGILADREHLLLAVRVRDVDHVDQPFGQIADQELRTVERKARLESGLGVSLERDRDLPPYRSPY